MAETVQITQTAPAAPVKRVSWGAIFAGVAVAFGVQVLLTVLGAAIGLTVVDPARESTSAQQLGIGAIVWWVIASIIALFIGGWVAGRLAGVPRSTEGALHGFVMWCIVTLLSVWLLGNAAGTVLGGIWGTLRGGAQAAATTGQQAPSGQEIRGAAERVLGPEGARQAETQVTGAAERAKQGAQETAREAKTQPEETKQKVAETAQKATEVGAKTTWSIFVMLLLGVIASVIGGAVGRPRELLTDERR